MGLTVLRVEVANVASPQVTEQIDFLIDSGAIYSVAPAPLLDKLGIKPLAEQEFRLADGSRAVRKKGGAVYKYGGRIGVADVIFGEEGDSVLLGAFTLEALGLALDPLKRELRPLPMILAGATRAAGRRRPMMKLVGCALAAALFLCGVVFAEQSPPPNGNEMPLELYQKLKGSFDALYGAQAGLLPGLAPPNKGETEKALRAEAAAGKDALLKALGSSQVLHREMAARALEYCGDKKAAVEALSRIVAADNDLSVRRAAAAALAKLPDAAAVESLIKGLSDNSDSVRGLCSTALGNIKDNRAGEPLLKLLATDSKPIVRLQAATALSKIKDKATLEGLTKALENEKDERVKMAIAGAVRNVIGGDTAQTEPVPSVDDVARELGNLAKEMTEVEEKLRNDRHDQAVQVQGTGIEKRLADLIQRLDKG